jgi:hypothetical protein
MCDNNMFYLLRYNFIAIHRFHKRTNWIPGNFRTSKQDLFASHRQQNLPNIRTIIYCAIRSSSYSPILHFAPSCILPVVYSRRDNFAVSLRRLLRSPRFALCTASTAPDESSRTHTLCRIRRNASCYSTLNPKSIHLLLFDRTPH